MKKLFYILSFLLIGITVWATNYPANVQHVLQKAGNNRAELEKVLKHYSNDSLKYKAACFLIGDMDIHYSETYQWKDSLGRNVLFNELDYPDFSTATAAFNKLKAKTPGIHPTPIVLQDIDVMTSDFLIDNIEKAFASLRLNRINNLTFDGFCEYILPYRISIEPLQSWRSIYGKKFKWIEDSLRVKDVIEVSKMVNEYTLKNFKNTYFTETRKEPLPRLGALQLLQRKKGPCEDMSSYQVFALRSLGFPASQEFIPYWASSYGKHITASLVFRSNRSQCLESKRTDTLDVKQFNREPGKVIRFTYARQPDVLADFTDKDNIPEGYLRALNYLDVTAQYWETKDLKCRLTLRENQSSIIYACVLSKLSWQPLWWAKRNGDSAIFSNMTKGVVYLPALYAHGKITPAGYPVALGYKNEQTLKADTSQLRSISISEQEGYLKFRAGCGYKLFYWEFGWKLLGAQKAEKDSHELLFDNVPLNALLVLVPEYSELKDRPFIITKEGVRVWF